MKITLEQLKAAYISKVAEAEDVRNFDTENDGQLIMRVPFFYWCSDKSIHTEREPKEVFEAWVKDDSRD